MRYKLVKFVLKHKLRVRHMKSCVFIYFKTEVKDVKCMISLFF